MIPFSPLGNTTVISTSTTSARGAITLDGTGDIIRLVNLSSAIAYIRLGDSTVTATNADVAIEPNGVLHLSINSRASATHVAGILSSGTGTLTFQLGRVFI